MLSKVKKLLKKIPFALKIYRRCLELRHRHILQGRLRYSGGFVNRSADSEILCIVLAGYKDFLWDEVFGRIKRFALEGMDICILSSGKHSDALENICAENGWSYLWTKRNNVSLIQNVAIDAHPKAKYIFKLDEDIFVTENYFKHMLKAYRHACCGFYEIGVLAPIIPMNSYGNVRVLEKLGLCEKYEEMFESPKFMQDGGRQLECNPDVAKFFWGEGGYFPSIDEINRRFWKDELEERPCCIRFTIGAILYERTLWEGMEYFKVDRGSSGMGQDEVELCSYCMLNSRPLLVSENIVVGHLSFSKQNQAMKEYYLSAPRAFRLEG